MVIHQRRNNKSFFSHSTFLYFIPHLSSQNNIVPYKVWSMKWIKDAIGKMGTGISSKSITINSMQSLCGRRCGWFWVQWIRYAVVSFIDMKKPIITSDFVMLFRKSFHNRDEMKYTFDDTLCSHFIFEFHFIKLTGFSDSVRCSFNELSSRLTIMEFEMCFS